MPPPFPPPLAGEGWGGGRGEGLPAALPTTSILVGEADFERELGRVRAAACGAVEGVFGPKSMLWRVDREAAVFLGAGRALVLQLAHPFVAAAIAERSPVLDDPIGRFHRTFRTVFTLVFGALDDAVFAARRLYRLHAGIEGPSYRANDLAALLWVHATLTQSALVAHDLVLPPLSAAEREAYYAETRLFAGLFGIPEAAVPANWREFSAYMEMMQQAGELAVGPEARRLAAAILSGARYWLPVPGWYRALTVGLLPPKLRADFGLPYGEAERRAAERALAVIRRLYPALPHGLRHVGPYQEALARLAGRGPGLRVGLLNRLWIGAARMPRAE
jgi:uncharacterized protein (DUF2236 family)